MCCMYTAIRRRRCEATTRRRFDLDTSGGNTNVKIRRVIARPLRSLAQGRQDFIDFCGARAVVQKCVTNKSVIYVCEVWTRVNDHYLIASCGVITVHGLFARVHRIVGRLFRRSGHSGGAVHHRRTARTAHGEAAAAADADERGGVDEYCTNSTKRTTSSTPLTIGHAHPQQDDTAGG